MLKANGDNIFILIKGLIQGQHLEVGLNGGPTITSGVVKTGAISFVKLAVVSVPKTLSQIPDQSVKHARATRPFLRGGLQLNPVARVKLVPQERAGPTVKRAGLTVRVRAGPMQCANPARDFGAQRVKWAKQSVTLLNTAMQAKEENIKLKTVLLFLRQWLPKNSVCKGKRK